MYYIMQLSLEHIVVAYYIYPSVYVSVRLSLCSFEYIVSTRALTGTLKSGNCLFYLQFIVAKIEIYHVKLHSNKLLFLAYFFEKICIRNIGNILNFMINILIRVQFHFSKL